MTVNYGEQLRAALGSGKRFGTMNDVAQLMSDPTVWAALVTLIVMEVVLGLDNLVFVSILSNKLPEGDRARVRRIGIGLALVMRLALLSTIAWIVALTEPVFDLGLAGASVGASPPPFETAFSWRDIILFAGGLFLVWKATREIHAGTDGHEHDGAGGKGNATMTVGAAIVQIVLLDIVFSIDSILTAVGMTDDLPVMVAAVVVAVLVMLLAANPLGDFIGRNPSVVTLALGFLLMIGTVLIAESFGVHVPKGYIYAAMGFSGSVEALNIWQRGRRANRLETL